LNPLHEVIQPEGECNYEGVLSKIHQMTQAIKTPIIAKETGAGISREDAKHLAKNGVNGFDVAGAGGTSFAAVETYRAIECGDRSKEELGHLFWDWGIPSAISTIEVRSVSDLPIIASGGIRDGIAVAKGLALGANAVGLALPFLQHTVEKNPNELHQYIKRLIRELKTTMFLVGARTINDLKQTDLVISGKPREWLMARGIDVNEFAQRSGKSN
jgi:isopentenyl-diphosphate delta-isomerase